MRFDKTEQAHLVVGAAAPARHDDRKYALDVASTIVGEGMSSRLFQEIRERRGLAYAVFSFAERFSNAGLFGVYAGCAPRKAAEVSKLIQHELHEIAEHGVSEDELVRVKGMISGSTLLGLEDTEARMRRLGVGELLYDRYTSVDDDLARCEAVTADDVRAIAADVFGGPWIVSAVGPLSADQL